MALTVLLTGATGALGPHLVTELLRSEAIDRIYAVVRPDGAVGAERAGRSDRIDALWAAITALSAGDGLVERARAGALVVINGDLRQPDLGLDDRWLARLCHEVDVIVHAGADTRFGNPARELHDTNVDGTRRLLQVAHRCRRLRHVVLVSTICVAGTRTGSIVEQVEDAEPPFVNEYERTKWQAERLAVASGLPVRIARLSICIGGERTGYVHRPGAVHHALGWLIRGLIPMLPGARGSRVDLIGSDVAAQWIAKAAVTPVDRLDVCHIAAGERAIALDDLVAFVASHLRTRHPAWRARQIDPPVIVSAETFELFRRSAIRTGDAILGRVLESASSFLPVLLHPKVYRTERAEQLWGGPLPTGDSRPTLARVIDGLCTDSRSRLQDVEASHV